MKNIIMVNSQDVYLKNFRATPGRLKARMKKEILLILLFGRKLHPNIS